MYGRLGPQTVAQLTSGRIFENWGLAEGSYVTEGCPWRGKRDLKPSSFSVSASQLPWGENLWATMCFHHDVLPHHRPKHNGAQWLWTRTSKSVNQNKPFLFLVDYLRVFVIVMESWLNVHTARCLALSKYNLHLFLLETQEEFSWVRFSRGKVEFLQDVKLACLSPHIF
jgi:hypothetical protein